MRPLLVFPDAFVVGIEGFGADGRPFNRRGAPGVGHVHKNGFDAIAKKYGTDAHCVGYSVPGSEGAHGRINKSAHAYLLDRGHEPLLYWAIIDVDNPDHTPWAQPDHAWASLLGRIRKAGGALESASVYLSPSGYRLMWPLKTPVPVSQCEGRLRGLLGWLSDRGIEGDPACSDWTRLFRLPRVVRDNKRLCLPLELKC